MITSLKIVNPNDLEAKISITMKLENWIKLREQLPRQWPSVDLIYQIDDLISQAQQVFYPKENK